MNLAAGERAPMAILVLSGRPFQCFLEPDAEREFVFVDLAVFDAALKTQERRGAEEPITFNLKQESLGIRRSPTVGDLTLPGTGNALPYRRITLPGGVAALELFMRLIPLPPQRRHYQQQGNRRA